MAYIVAILAVIVAALFWYVQKTTREQEEQRRQKRIEMDKTRARIAARKKAEQKNTEEE